MRHSLLISSVVVVLSLSACSDEQSSAASADDAGAEGADGDAGIADDAGAVQEFLLLSYNVAGLPQEFSSENPTLHLPLISPLLNAYDIVMTQEDFDWWVPALDGYDFVNYHSRLRAEVDHEYQTEKHPGPEAVGLDLDMHTAPNVGDGLGFLSRFEFSDVVRVPWTSCFGGFDSADRGAGDCLAMKGFMVARFTLAKDVEVDIYTLHGEAGATELDQQLQADGMDKLAAFIDEHSAGRAIIVGGDTNLHTAGDHPDSSGDLDGEIWSTFLQAAQLTDACDALACDEPGAIDKIAFRNGSGAKLEAIAHHFEAEKFVGPEAEPLSDHLALAVRFRWSTAATK